MIYKIVFDKVDWGSSERYFGVVIEFIVGDFNKIRFDLNRLLISFYFYIIISVWFGLYVLVFSYL